jgi:DNA polymerase III subunit epsilon
MYLFFDTESSGLPKNWKAPVTALDNWPRLVQLAYLCFDSDGNQTDSGNYIVKPEGFSIPSEATAVHGISNDRALAEGTELKSVMEEFHGQIGRAELLVAHNISFDEKIVGAEFLRLGMENTLPGKKKICTMSESVDFCAIKNSYGNKWPKLSELHHKLFNCGFQESHNASVDVAVTAKCFWELKRLGVI